MTYSPDPSRCAPFAVGWIAIVLTMTGCVSPPEPVPEPSPVLQIPDEFPEQDYRAAAARGEPVLRIDSSSSVVQIRVYRAGALARLGHDHAVTARDVHGYARRPAGDEARADLYLALADLAVDDPDARATAGFTSEPTAADRDGTYRNMLVSLDAVQYPFVLLHVTVPAIESSGEYATTVDLTLHGVTRRLTVPISITFSGAGFRVAGTFTIRQTDFGITPFSVFGGALAVRDELELFFDLGFIGF